MNGRRVAIAVAALTATWVCLGCRVQREFPPQPMRIIGTSYDPAAAKQATAAPEVAAAASITASGDGDAPATALDPIQGRLVARQIARQAARRELARKVDALDIPPGRKVADVLRGDPEKRRKVEDLIRQARQKGLIKSDGNKCTVFLTLDLRPLNTILELPGEPFGPLAAGTTSPTAARQEVRRRAENEALENARIRALEYVKSLRIEGVQTLGDRMLRDDALDRAIRAKIASLSSAGVAFREDGVCEAAVDLDLADIQRILEEHRRGLQLPVDFHWPRISQLWRRFRSG